MNLLELTTTIQRQRLVIAFTTDGQVAAGPKAKLTPVVRQAIAEHKNELQKLLAPPSPSHHPTGVFCPFCKSKNLLDGTTAIWCTDCEERALLLTSDDW